MHKNKRDHRKINKAKRWFFKWINKILRRYNVDLEQIISQFAWKYKKTSNSQSNLEKEEWNWRNQPG